MRHILYIIIFIFTLFGCREVVNYPVSNSKPSVVRIDIIYDKPTYEDKKVRTTYSTTCIIYIGENKDSLLTIIPNGFFWAVNIGINSRLRAEYSARDSIKSNGGIVIRQIYKIISADTSKVWIL
jgi:hypothetical protein